MNRTHATRSIRSLAKTALAGLLVGLLLLAAFAGHSAELHHWVHADHQSTTHHCLVTVLDQHGNDVSPTAVLISSSAGTMESAPRAASLWLVSRDLALQPGRGPPVNC
jgi:hypothetical protein